MIIFVKYMFSLGAHVTHMPNLLGICDVMSVWSWAHVILVLVLMMCTDWQWTYVRHMLAYVLAYVYMTHVIIV